MQRFPRAILLLSCVAFVACASLWPRKEAPPSALYTLDEIGPIQSRPKPLCRALAISPMRSAPGYGSARMVYTRRDHQIEFFAFHQWADTPANMLYTLLVKGIEKSGLFAIVLPAESGEKGNVRLDTELTMLRQSFDDGDSQLELSVRAQVFSNEEILGSRTFEISEEAGSGPQTGVDAANRATIRLLSEMFVWLDEVLSYDTPVCNS